MQALTRSLLLTAIVLLAGCAGSHATPTVPDHQAAWDSQDGNPTHATHSYLTEYACNQLQGSYPELVTYRAKIVDGANREIHDIALSDPTQEALRIADGGNNWACSHPEVVWNTAKAKYAAGDKASAYWYLGILLHYVEDMGVPAHAFHVYHQSSPSNWDNFEVLAFQKWAPSYSSINKTDPGFSSPDQYVVWDGTWAAGDFNATWPGVTYKRTFFSTSWLWASSKEKTFMYNRQGRCAVATKWALQCALNHWN